VPDNAVMFTGPGIQATAFLPVGSYLVGLQVGRGLVWQPAASQPRAACSNQRRVVQHSQRSRGAPHLAPGRQVLCLDACSGAMPRLAAAQQLLMTGPWLAGWLQVVDSTGIPGTASKPFSVGAGGTGVTSAVITTPGGWRLPAHRCGLAWGHAWRQGHHPWPATAPAAAPCSLSCSLLNPKPYT
jgi:hypothetical protein